MATVTPLRTRMMDTLTNLVSGMGLQGRSKSAHDSFAQRILTPAELEAAYRSDWIARKIIDIPPADMTREWREWKADDADIEKLEELEKTLNVRGKVRDAMRLDRLCGGSLIVMGGLPGNPQDELKPESLGADALKYLIVFNRYQVSVPEIDRDPLSPFFGEPTVYQVNSPKTGSVNIHPSRVVRFVDRKPPELLMQTPDGWGDPLLLAIYDAVHHASAAQQATLDLMLEAKIDVVSIPNLMASVGSTAEKDNLLTRFALAALAKGQNNILLLDKEEVYAQKQVSFAQIPEIGQGFLQVAAAAADIPVTRMLGQSPKGLSATGDMDLQNYYDGLGGIQNNDLRPKMDRLDEVMIRSALGTKPDDLWWEFAPLWQMSDKDKAAVALQKAQASQIYINSAVVPDDAIALGIQAQLVEDGTYPGLEQFIAKSTMEVGLLTKPDPSEDPALDPNNPDNGGGKPAPAKSQTAQTA